MQRIHCKCTADIESPLMTREPRLRCSGALALQSVDDQLCSKFFGQRPHSTQRDTFGLVESALVILTVVQGNGNNYGIRADFVKQWRDRVGQGLAQDVRCRPDAVVFQKMDQIPQHAFVWSTGNGSNVCRTHLLAKSAQGGTLVFAAEVAGTQQLSADCTLGT